MSTSPLSRVGLSADEETTSGSTGNRKVVLGVAGLLTAGMALVASLLLGGGSEDLEDLGAPPAPAAAAPTASASPSARPAQPQSPDSSTARDGRDPFEPLYTEPRLVAVAPAAPEPGAAAPQAVPPPVPAVADGSAAGNGSAPVTAGTGPTGGEQPSVGTGTSSIALLRTEGSDQSRVAVFTVDGTQVSVAVGESFGPSDSLLLLSLQQGPAANGWTAVVQLGQGEPFDVVTGVVTAVPVPGSTA